MIPYGCQEWGYHLFCKNKLKIIQRYVVVVLASISLSSDERELNFAIVMVDSFNLLKCSSKTPSIEMDFQPEKYCE